MRGDDEAVSELEAGGADTALEPTGPRAAIGFGVEHLFKPRRIIEHGAMSGRGA